MLLPTDYYLMGGAATVAVSFCLLLFASKRWVRMLADCRKILFTTSKIPSDCGSYVVFVVLLLLIFSGFSGSTDPLANPLPLSVWTVWWIGFPLLQFLIGDIWRTLNPWVAPVRLTRRCLNLKPSILPLPRCLGYAPAIVLYFGFAWFELVDLAPEDPFRLATVLSLYWFVNYIGTVLFGDDDWFERAEPFSIFFRLIGTCSPFMRGRSDAEAVQGRTARKVSLVWPGQGFLHRPPLPFSGILFVLLTLSSVSFDGLSKTFYWLRFIAVNPLDFPGRSGVQMAHSIGLLGAFLVLTGLVFLAIFLGMRLAGVSVSVNALVSVTGRLVYSIIPISIVFHLAHYCTVLLVNGQYWLLALNDPLGLGWNLWGYQHHVTTSFLSNLHSVSRIWTFQTVVIVLGHVIGIVIAHLLTVQLVEKDGYAFRTVILSQLFLVILMVGYTVFGLWLLSTASIG